MTENAIQVRAGRLRRRIEGMGVTTETVRGLGYRMDGPPLPATRQELVTLPPDHPDRFREAAGT